MRAVLTSPLAATSEIWESLTGHGRPVSSAKYFYCFFGPAGARFDFRQRRSNPDLPR